MRALPYVVGAGVLLGAVIVMQKKASAEMAVADTSLDSLFEKWGKTYGVDPLLIKAHAVVESSMDPNAVNRSDPSYGLMQILCTNSDGGACRNVFNIDGWSGMTVAKLLNPDVNIRMAAQIIKYNLGFGLPRAIAVYNSWDQRNAPINGPFKNQSYVDKVSQAYRSLGGNDGRIL